MLGCIESLREIWHAACENQGQEDGWDNEPRFQTSDATLAGLPSKL